MRLLLLCLLGISLGCAVVGCNSGTISDSAQNDKAKAMGIARRDPNNHPGTGPHAGNHG